MPKSSLAAALAAAIPILAAAQADDPAAAAPLPTYRSALAGVPRGVEEGSTPWKEANAEVGQFPRGHVDLLKWEERQPGAAAPAPARPASAAPGHRH